MGIAKGGHRVSTRRSAFRVLRVGEVGRAVGGLLFAIAALSAPSSASAACSDPVGDVTGEGKVNVADTLCITLTTLYTAGGSQGAAPACLAGGGLFQADFNCDGTVNVSDAILHVHTVLGNPLDPAIDADGNFCPDACQTPALGGPPVVVPTYFYGTATGGGLVVRPLAPGSTATGASSGGGLTVKPKAVGATPP